jgi:serine/threonine protein kinase
MIPGLIVTSGYQQGKYIEFPEGLPYWIGRAPTVDFIIKNDPLVSSRHCFLVRKGEQLAFKDDSTNGTQLNGRKIQKAATLLKYADILRIGNTHFQVTNMEENSCSSEKIDIVACKEDLKKRSLNPEDQENFIPQIGSYLNIEIIGSGAAGTVYKSIDESKNRLVALKVFGDLEGMGREFTGRFLREIELLKQLESPSIIRLYEAGTLDFEGESYGYIALEYFQGVNLHNHLRVNGVMDWEDVFKILYQTTEGIDHMHSKGILHRDMKPGNIMFHVKKKRAKIIDLGLGKSVSSEERQTLCITQPGSVMGTPNFMPIEQWGGLKNVDVRADLYSLGASIYFLLTGELPYGAHRDFTQIYRSILQRTLTPLEELCAEETPKEFIAVIEKMMAFEAKERYANATEVLNELQKIATHYHLS